MSKKGNGEGSIYPHKRNGKKVGYRGAYTVYSAQGPQVLLRYRKNPRGGAPETHQGDGRPRWGLRL